MKTILCASIGVLLGSLAWVGANCAGNWYYGGTADPRCLYLAGYIEVHFYSGGASERVTCEYRAELRRR